MKLSEALDIVYGRDRDWTNPIWPYVVSSAPRVTPYEAYKDLKDDYKILVRRMIGHEPEKNEDVE